MDLKKRELLQAAHKLGLTKPCPIPFVEECSPEGCRLCDGLGYCTEVDAREYRNANSRPST